MALSADGPRRRRRYRPASRPAGTRSSFRGRSRPLLNTSATRCATLRWMFTVHATKKLLDRVKTPIEAPVGEPSTTLGNWYATALFWKPQVALFVNETTLLPVLVPLAPAKALIDRFPTELERVLTALDIDPDFVSAEVAATTEGRYAKTANRSVREHERVLLLRRGPPRPWLRR